MYEIDRFSAAKLLKVSERSIDRYIRKGYLSARQANGRVFLSRKELMDFKLSLQKGLIMKKNLIPAVPEILEKFPSMYGKHGKSDRFINAPHTNDMSFYRDLYEQTLHILEEKEQKLQAAHYRIGQLESQTSSPFRISPIPSTEKNVEYRLETLANEMKELKKKLEKSNLNRKIISFILYFVLLLQPLLWYFLE